MAGAHASSSSASPERRPRADLADALDHLLDPVEVVPLHSRARSRRRTGVSTARPAVTPQAGRELCHISYWRGYVKSQFVAVTDVDGRPVALSTSPFFRARAEVPPENDDRARRAHAALREELARDGWELAARGETWYGETFRRLIPRLTT
jgi:hypothetical protein